jgi:hypothetical protein
LIEYGKAGTNNAPRVNPEYFRKQCEREIKMLQETSVEAMLELRPKKFQSTLGKEDP